MQNNYIAFEQFLMPHPIFSTLNFLYNHHHHSRLVPS